MGLREITYEEAKRELERAVNVKGRDHEPGASVICDDRGNPVCGVGQVFYQIDPEKFKAVRPSGWVLIPAAEMELSLEERAAELLGLFQKYQDGNVIPGRHAWGEALDYALSKMEGVAD